jgi:hypothetical protein
MVIYRHEATGIPNLLVAPKTPPHSDGREIYEDGVGDYRGRYEDGAFYAQASSDEEEDEESGKDPQLMYFDSILTRYEALRTQLQQTPPQDAVRRLDEDHPTHVGRLNTQVARWWKWKLRTVDPVPGQIASMDKTTVLRLLGLMMGGTILKRGSDVEMVVSRWAWSLLARLPERGELTSEEIGVVRELGKKAVLVSMGLKEEKSWEAGMQEVEAGFDSDVEEEEVADIVNDEEIQLDYEDDLDIEDDAEQTAHPIEPPIQPTVRNQNDSTGGQPGSIAKGTKGATIGPQLPHANGDTNVEVEGGAPKLDSIQDIPEDLAAAKARMLKALSNSNEENDAVVASEEASRDARTESRRLNTRATMDMIITVAGEVYGQRDLLEFRGAWGEIM